MKIAVYLTAATIILIIASVAMPSVSFRLAFISLTIKPWLLLCTTALFSALAGWLAARHLNKKAGNPQLPASHVPSGSSLSPEDQDYLNLS